MPKQAVPIDGGYEIVDTSETGLRSTTLYNSSNQRHGLCITEEKFGNGVHKTETYYSKAQRHGTNFKYLNGALIESNYYIMGKECGRRCQFEKGNVISNQFVWNGQECTEEDFDEKFRQWVANNNIDATKKEKVFKESKLKPMPSPFSGCS